MAYLHAGTCIDLAPHAPISPDISLRHAAVLAAAVCYYAKYGSGIKERASWDSTTGSISSVHFSAMWLGLFTFHCAARGAGMDSICQRVTYLVIYTFTCLRIPTRIHQSAEANTHEHSLNMRTEHKHITREPRNTHTHKR